MIKYHEIRIGDYLKTEQKEKTRKEVVNLNGDEKQVCVETEVQEFWFAPELCFP